MPQEKTLDVFWDENLVGNLIQTTGGQLQFRYAGTWLGSSNPVQLSQSLPLRKEAFTQKECRSFFAGILPEQAQRELIAKNLGINPKNDWAMLARIGGECAGAITFLPAGETPSTCEQGYRPLPPDELEEVLRTLPRRPLMAGEGGIRLSLAGAQNKLAVHVDEGRVSVPVGLAPSTHILKPDHPQFPGLIVNEAFCMRLAKLAGLRTAEVLIGRAGDFDYLLIERYDRTHIRKNGSLMIGRLHQEDFCQALGVVPEHKYQADGGPSLRQCFQLIREAATVPGRDLIGLLHAVCFNLIIGNNDAHAKNFSLLYHPPDATEPRVALAPLYDLISTTVYSDLSADMAMKIGSAYNCNRVTLGDYDDFVTQALLARAPARRILLDLIENVMSRLWPVAEEISGAHPVAEAIRERCSGLLTRFKG